MKKTEISDIKGKTTEMEKKATLKEISKVFEKYPKKAPYIMMSYIVINYPITVLVLLTAIIFPKALIGLPVVYLKDLIISLRK